MSKHTHQLLSINSVIPQLKLNPSAAPALAAPSIATSALTSAIHSKPGMMAIDPKMVESPAVEAANIVPTAQPYSLFSFVFKLEETPRFCVT